MAKSLKFVQSVASVEGPEKDMPLPLPSGKGTFLNSRVRPLVAWAVGRCEMRPSSWRQRAPLPWGNAREICLPGDLGLEGRGTGREGALVERGVQWLGLGHSAKVLLVQHWWGGSRQQAGRQEAASFVLSRGEHSAQKWGLGAQTLTLSEAVWRLPRAGR